MVSREQATLPLIGVEIVSFAALFHDRESIIRQVAQLIVLRGRGRALDLEPSREKRSPHIGISDIARLRGARGQPQDCCCGCTRGD